MRIKAPAGAGRYGARVDKNQPAITRALRQCGYHVADTHRLGHGFVDIIVTGWHAGLDAVVALLVEIKSERGKLTYAEEKFHEDYPADGPLIVARSTDDILRWFDRLTPDGDLRVEPRRNDGRADESC